MKDPGHPLIWNDVVVHTPPGSLSERLLRLITGCHSWASDLTWAPLMQKDRRHPHRLEEILIPSSAHNIREQTPRLMAESFCLYFPVLKVTSSDLEKYWGIIFLQQSRPLFNRTLPISCNMLPNTQTSRVTHSQASTFHTVTSTFWFLQIDNVHGKKVKVVVAQSRPTLGNPVEPVRVLSPRNSPGKNTGVGSCSLLQGISPAQGSNPGLPHCRQILHQLSHQGSPRILEWVAYPFSRDSSWPRDQTRVSCTAGGFFTSWATRDSPVFP